MRTAFAHPGLSLLVSCLALGGCVGDFPEPPAEGDALFGAAFGGGGGPADAASGPTPGSVGSGAGPAAPGAPSRRLDASAPPDAAAPDAGPPDAGPPDAGPPDAGPPDVAPPCEPDGRGARYAGMLWGATDNRAGRSLRVETSANYPLPYVAVRGVGPSGEVVHVGFEEVNMPGDQQWIWSFRGGPAAAGRYCLAFFARPDDRDVEAFIASGVVRVPE